MEIQLRSQVDADVQQIFDNLHSLKDQPKLTTALSLDKKGEI
ncbi:MAG: hypothetical protein ACYTXT_32060 [Nostoc sp.]|nr:hypothetical protein [Nostoc sp. JL31]